jgi:SP family general alpha glucoside:H+ symporter-like MFS transporter
MDENKDDIQYLESAPSKDRLGGNDHTEAIGHLAQQEAHDETPWQAVKNHPWATAWVIYGIAVVTCCSFDNNAGGNVLSIPKFREDYGSPFAGSFVLPAQWQSAYSGGPAAASVFGTFGGSCKLASFHPCILDHHEV